VTADVPSPKVWFGSELTSPTVSPEIKRNSLAWLQHEPPPTLIDFVRVFVQTMPVGWNTWFPQLLSASPTCLALGCVALSLP
jgi:hypothetical protein